MLYGLLIAATVALIALYKFLPNKKFFPYVCGAVIVIFGASAFIKDYYGNAVMTRAQLEALQLQQKIFGEWYAAYQKDIDSLDRNWQLYHNILDGLKTMDAQSFNAEAIYLRLKELEQESLDEQLKIQTLNPPQGLDKDNRDFVEVVIKKTQRYAEAQTRTITLSVQAATPPVELEILQARLNDIMIRESPEGLFTAQEISAIRAALDDASD